VSLVPLQSRVELQLNGSWVDVSDWLLDRPIRHRLGTGDEARRLRPAEYSFELDNSDGRFTPGNPTSPYYPHLRLNVPARWSIAAGSPHLTTTGNANSRATTPDDSALDITGDLFIGFELEPSGLPGTGQTWEVAAKRVLAGDQRSYGLFITEAGRIHGRWSTDGTAANERTATSVPVMPRPLWDTYAGGWWQDVNNGAGGTTGTFYFARTLAEILADPAGTVLGDPVVAATTTSIFNSTAPLEVGDSVGSGFTPMPGRCRRLQVRAGDTAGAIRADVDFTALAVGTTAFTDDAGLSWTVAGDATVDNWHTQQLGEIVAVEPAWTDGDPGLPTVRVTVASVVRRLQQRRKALKSPLTRQITSPFYADNVVGHWPWEDASSSPMVASSLPGGQAMTIGGEIRLGSSSPLPSTASVGQVSAGQPYGFGVSVPAGPASASTTWRVSFLVEVPEVDATAVPIQVVSSRGTARMWVLQASSAGWTIAAFDANGGALFLNGPGAWASPMEEPSIIHISAEQNGGNIDYRTDWIPMLGEFAGSTYAVTGSFAGTMGRVTNLAVLGSAAAPSGLSWGQMVVSTGTALNWLAPGDSAYIGETAAARYKRLCDEEGIPVLIEGDVTDSRRMGPQPIASLLDTLDDCVAADGGVQVEQRYVAGLGLKTLRACYNQAPRVSLDAARVVGAEVHGDLNLPFSPVLDDQRALNDVTATRPYGASARATTNPAPDPAETYDGQFEVNVSSDGQLRDVAGWLLHAGTTDHMRCSEVRSNLIDRDYLVDDWLHTGPGDVVEITNVPQMPPDPILLLREGGAVEVDTTTLDTTATTSPASIYEVGVRDDPNRGKRGSSTSTLAADFDAGTDTSMSVAVGSGLLWTTDAGEMPIELDVGGARINVTAIAGAASPQTFTVDATALNGVVKTVPAGTQVRLWRPTIRAR
jgi:hypothetical protein